jgi:hypothetical protein
MEFKVAGVFVVAFALAASLHGDRHENHIETPTQQEPSNLSYENSASTATVTVHHGGIFFDRVTMTRL